MLRLVKSIVAALAAAIALVSLGLSAAQPVAEDVKRAEHLRIINAPAEVGGHPEMKGGEPPVDSDHDGMPDDWETKMGFNPRDETDAAADHDGDGYTNIEAFLHELAGKR